MASQESRVSSSSIFAVAGGADGLDREVAVAQDDPPDRPDITAHELDAAFGIVDGYEVGGIGSDQRSEEHTSELQSLMRISYAVFCLKKKKQKREKRQINKRMTKNHKLT